MRIVRTILIGMLLAGCGGDQSLEFSETLVVGIIGVFTAPDDATGNAEPRNVTLTLEDVQIVASDSGTVDLYTDEAEEFKVASRSQIIFEADLADYVDQEITSLQVTFASAATASGKYEEELAITFDDVTVEHTEAFTVSAAQTNRINIQLEWLNIITRDEDADPPTETISAPSFATELED